MYSLHTYDSVFRFHHKIRSGFLFYFFLFIILKIMLCLAFIYLFFGCLFLHLESSTQNLGDISHHQHPMVAPCNRTLPVIIPLELDVGHKSPPINKMTHCRLNQSCHLDGTSMRRRHRAFLMADCHLVRFTAELLQEIYCSTDSSRHRLLRRHASR